MENGTISRLTSSTGIQQNSRHYIPILMTNGKNVSESVFSLLGENSRDNSAGNSTSARKESRPSPSPQPTQDSPTRTPATSSQTTASVPGSIASAPSKSLSLSQQPRPREPSPSKQLTLVQENSKESPSKIPASTSSAGQPSVSSTTSKVVERDLSDFDGSDLSDLSSGSSGSDQEMLGDDDDSSQDDEESDQSRSEDENGRDGSSVESSSDEAHAESTKLSKRRHLDHRARSRAHRRIDSDSSEDERGYSMVKKNAEGLSTSTSKTQTASSPRPPTSSTFSPDSKKKSRPHEMADQDAPTSLSVDAGRKTKQPDFNNVGKRDRSGRTQLFKYTALGDLEVCRKLIEAGAQVNDRDYAEWTPLHEACVTGHEKVAALLIRHQADVNAQGGHLDTPLHDAAQNGHVEVVKLLLAHGANVLAKNAKGVIPLDVSDDKEVTSLLQERQALVNMLTNKNQAGQTVLHRACSSGSYDNVVDLVIKGADIHAQDHAQWTPLHEAALAGHTRVVEFLLSRGANPNAQGHGDDTALHDAAQNEHDEVVKLLLEYGADPDLTNSKGEKPADVSDHDGILELLASGLRATKKPIAGLSPTPLSSSSSLSSLSSQSSKNLNSTRSATARSGTRRSEQGKGSRRRRGSTEDGMSEEYKSTSEDRHARGQLSRDERKMQQVLSTIRRQEQMEERRKARMRPSKQPSDDDDEDEVDEEEDDHNRRSKSPRPSSRKQNSPNKTSRSSTEPHRSCKVHSRKDHSTSKRQHSRSGNRDESGSESGKQTRSKRSVQRSLGDRFRIDHRFKDSAGRTQLHQWSEAGDIEMVGTLLEGGFERDPVDHDGSTPLHLAAKAGNTEVLVLLLAYGSNVNAQDHDQATALHEAVRRHHTDAVRLLLQNNALVGLRDSRKRTSLELASTKDQEIRSLLQQAHDQAEKVAQERSKKRLSQAIEARDAPKHKERKTSRQSDSEDVDRPISSKKKDKDVDRRESEGRKHAKTGSSSSNILKSASILPIARDSPTHPSANSASSSTSRHRNGSDLNVDESTTPLKKQKLQGHKSSSSGSNLHTSREDVEIRSASSKKRRDAEIHADIFGAKVKIKKEREEEVTPFRSSHQASKSEEARRATSGSGLSRDAFRSQRPPSSQSAAVPSKGSSAVPVVDSHRRPSSSGSFQPSSVATISPPMSEPPSSTSPPPPPLPISQTSVLTPGSAPHLPTALPNLQEIESGSGPLKSRKRNSQTFTSSNGYLKFADELKLVSAPQQHHRQKSLSSLSRTVTEEASLPTDSDSARKKPKTATSEPQVDVDTKHGKRSSKIFNRDEAPRPDPPSLSQSMVPPVSNLANEKRHVEETLSDRPIKIEKAIPEEEEEVVKPELRSVQDAQRYLPLYTVQLSGDTGDAAAATENGAKVGSNVVQQHFCVVDRQVQLLLGLLPGTLFGRYPHLYRRVVTKREKARLWSPLSSMVSDRCAAAVKLNFEVLPAECQFSSWTNATTAMSRLKEHEKQKFLGSELHFIRLEEVIEVIRRDYGQLNESMMTIMLDIGYEESEMEVDEAKEEDKEEKIQIKEEKVEAGIKVKVELDDLVSKEKDSVLDSAAPVPEASTTTTTLGGQGTGLSSGGYVHKMRRVPAKMATKAMFKEMQQHQFLPHS